MKTVQTNNFINMEIISNLKTELKDFEEKTYKDSLPTLKESEIIQARRFRSKTWNRLYLKTFCEKELNAQLITGDTLCYYGQFIAYVKIKYTAARSGSPLDNKYLIDLINYDYFTGKHGSDNYGAEDSISAAVGYLAERIGKTLNDIEDNGKSVFINALSVVRKETYLIDRYNKTLSFDAMIDLNDIETAIYTDMEEDNGGNYDELINILEHIHIRDEQLMRLKMSINGMSHPQIAKERGVTKQSVDKTFYKIREKIAAYCQQNPVPDKVIQAINKYLD